MTVPFTTIDQLYIDGTWHAAEGGSEAVVNPATEEVIGHTSGF